MVAGSFGCMRGSYVYRFPEGVVPPILCLGLMVSRPTFVYILVVQWFLGALHVRFFVLVLLMLRKVFFSSPNRIERFGYDLPHPYKHTRFLQYKRSFQTMQTTCFLRHGGSVQYAFPFHSSACLGEIGTIASKEKTAPNSEVHGVRIKTWKARFWGAGLGSCWKAHGPTLVLLVYF